MDAARDGSIEERAAAQKRATSSWARKVWQFVRLHFTANAFEAYVLAHEANDCSLVAKYHTVVEVPTAAQPLVLNAVHIPHSLDTFLRKNEPEPAIGERIRRDLELTPVVLFIHGLGGQLSQFEPLMALFAQCLEVWGVDLPGFGNSRLSNGRGKSISDISPRDQRRILQSVARMLWHDFETHAIVTVIFEFVRKYIPDKKIVVVGHSMGTHLAVKLVTRLPAAKVEAMILLSPPPFKDDLAAAATPPQAGPARMLRIFSYVPWLFDLFRIWDRLEGLDSKLVLRQLGPQTNLYHKLRQLRWNLDIESAVVLRYAYGFERATVSDLVAATAKFNDDHTNRKTYVKTLIVGGLCDQVTPVRTIHQVCATLNAQYGRIVSQAIEIKDVGHSILLSKPEFTSGTIINFVEQNCPERLHLLPAWVLKVKAEASGDKWGLKNELKWKALQLVSHNITRSRGHGATEVSPLLGMKTLREDDAEHLPSLLEARFYDVDGHLRPDGHLCGSLIAVVDISHDIPPYSPTTFRRVKYYKCSTVSKVVPDQGAIRRFIHLVDAILEGSRVERPLIAVHCHYGFNRTGFLICCYLVERLGWTVQQAVEGYSRAKPPGIKHPHFIDALYVRYEK